MPKSSGHWAPLSAQMATSMFCSLWCVCDNGLREIVNVALSAGRSCVVHPSGRRAGNGRIGLEDMVPDRPKRLCPRCGAIVQGSCTACRKQREARRGDGHEFYWTSEWKKFRRWFASSNPLCWFCEQEGRLTPMQDVDHWPVPRAQLPRDRWCDPDCCKPACRACHAKHGATRRRAATHP